MAQVAMRIGGRTYTVDCRDGEEARVAELGHLIDARAGELAESLGTMGEARLLLSTAILLADELLDARAAIEAAAARVERLADALEAGGEKA